MESFLLFSAHGKQIDGLRVIADDRVSPARTAVEEALGLIKRYDPVRYSRLSHDLQRVWVTVLVGNQGEYSHRLRTCKIDTRFVLAEASRPELIASVIVHEATHARLLRCGIGYEEALRARVERACYRQMDAFAAKLPDGEPVHTWVAQGMALPHDTWTNESMKAHYDEAAPEALRYLGTPEWAIRAMFRGNAFLRRVLRAPGR